MADDLHYVGGTWYRICDRTGFKIRNWRTRKEWTGRWVRDQSFEERQPQDFVRGVIDEQFVPEPRPRQLNVFLGPLQTMTTADINAGETVIPVQSTIRMSVNDSVEVMMSNGEYFLSKIADIPSRTAFQLQSPLPWFVTSGSFVTDTTAQTYADINTTPWIIPR